ncbi:protein sickie isoform X2 [Phlebotomus argentipes]|uniref:protein sickie isoform X2 n=1 Tax=Phlebotomus argentipes TaxID=94469 RepID=UPI002892C27C|nr:protein sickie isoform X2 [Phlebotomus argentipes]XP_059615181.1 protein sickie isoform X2 [Phlebotomus argentipes]XP_059615182.1 protein sickie isoform X2 [Phlebotomus argentipes]XP_059615184.1 protein sickie isoform X2 [Phlebotomus argentipes]XP_059615185.1 protein sickie isoform X2 [Phlebotomus argentipes]XP_059615186.1 protein sickie isoform X2 [Phlebotomus argentipes]XP_059615187.1 protein sickie isoform X2 [Phlebotomus argentipes]XP_059615188.1 protein sickie isoform X2 [Phlebotomus
MSRDSVHHRHQVHSNGLATIRPRGHYRSSAYIRAEDSTAGGEDDIFFSLRHASSDSRFYWPNDVNDNVQKSAHNGAIYDTPCLSEGKRAKRSNTLRSFRKPKSVQALHSIHVTVPDCGSILELDESGNASLPPNGRLKDGGSSAPRYGTIRMRTKSESQENGSGSVDWERKYSTLGNVRRTRGTTHEVNSSCHSLNYFDPLDCKIGCQTTLRSKPQIPWYELAIRQNNRRLSCPPLDELNEKAHVVSAFEQSLSNMTQRFNQLSASAERKDSELTDLRQTIELLRKQSIQAGLTSAHMQSMGVQASCQPAKSEHKSANSTSTGTDMQRHHSSDSMCSLNSISSGCSTQDKKKKKGWLRSSFTKAFSRNAKISKTNRQVNNNVPSVAEMGLPPPSPNTSVQEKVVTPASPTKSPVKQPVTVIENAKPIDAIVELEGNLIVEDLKKQLREKDLVLTDIRLEALSSASQLESLKDTVMKMRAEMINLKQNNERLQKLVTSRSLAGSSGSLGAPLSPNGSLNEPRRYSLVDTSSRPPMELPNTFEETEEENIPPAPAPDPPQSISPTSHIDLTPPPQVESVPPESMNTAVVDDIDHLDGKKISIAVYLGQPDSFQKYSEEIMDCDYYYANVAPTDSLSPNGENGDNANFNEFTIAFTYISGKTTWQNLDYIVRKTFKDYLSKIDPGTSLGLNTDSITSYHLGEAKRGPEMGFPELLPCGYIIGNVKTLYICLQGVGSLAFDSLIPRSIVHRYISLLTEHRRLILCGPSGTGKSYLARKLAEFLVARSGRGNPTEAIATFNVDHKSSKELQQYLVHVAEQASMVNCVSELPSVIILDNLHHASALGDVFSCLLSAGPASKLPCIIGTMSQATCNTTNLQLHHNFRWVLTANHMEPVKGFLARFLRRKLFVLELMAHTPQPQLSSVLAWLPTVWQHINRFLETHNSSDVTIGPRLFLSCPLDMNDSQVWFTDVWNYHLAPYLVNAVREGVQLYGRRGGIWVDPSTYIRDTYPWPVGPTTVPSLRQINAEDVGLEAGPTGSSEQQDPLLNMLMRLQEAANYTNNQDQESDCASLDSNITQDSFAGGD